MRFRDVLKYRDDAIKIALFNLIDRMPAEQQSAARNAVQEALNSAAVDWEKEYVPAFLGEKGAEEWRRLQDRPVTM